MNTSTHVLKNDKLTFAVVIGILLCSLIYTSGYILVVKEENEKFKHELRIIEEEMNLLFTFLPTQGQENTQQKQQILRQVEKIRKDFYQNNISSVSKQELLSQLSAVKNQVVSLEKHAKEIDERETNYIAAAAATQMGEAMDSTDPPTKSVMKPVSASLPHLSTQSAETIVEKKLSVYYFNVFSSDPESRYQHTKQITTQLQLQGDLELLNDPYLYVEIRDPNNTIISTGRDRIMAVTGDIASYTFVPNSDKPFQKGRYVVKVFSANREFKHIAFLTLI